MSGVITYEAYAKNVELNGGIPQPPYNPNPPPPPPSPASGGNPGGSGGSDSSGGSANPNKPLSKDEYYSQQGSEETSNPSSGYSYLPTSGPDMTQEQGHANSAYNAMLGGYITYEQYVANAILNGIKPLPNPRSSKEKSTDDICEDERIDVVPPVLAMQSIDIEVDTTSALVNYFDTADDAARDWAYRHYGITNYILMEVSSLIYAIYYGDTLVGYSYTTIIVGSPHSATGIWDGYDLVPDNGRVIAYIHSHPNSTVFSQRDKDIAQGRKISAYAVVPGKIGTVDVIKYSEKPSQKVWVVSTIATNMQFRELRTIERGVLVLLYRNRWVEHITNQPNCWAGCPHKTWPNV